MPIGKDIYKKMARRSGERAKRIEKITEERMRKRLGPVEPPTVEQFKKNIVSRTKSNSVHITELVGTGPRLISPNEAMPAVNGKSGEEVVKKAVSKTKPKATELSPTAGAIHPVGMKNSKKSTSRKNSPRRCSSCNQVGHTKRSCPELS